jgi:hypothetical protein
MRCEVDVSAVLTYILNPDTENAIEPGDSFGAVVRHDDWPGWSFGVDLSESGGLLGFRIELDRDARRRGERITTTEMRRIPLPALALAARAAIVLGAEHGPFAEEVRPVMRVSERGGKPLSNEYLARAMWTYVDAVADGHSTAEAARRFHVSPPTMKRYRDEAVRRGLFEAFGSGRRGGSITSKGWALLQGVQR